MVRLEACGELRSLHSQYNWVLVSRTKGAMNYLLVVCLRFLRAPFSAWKAATANPHFWVGPLDHLESGLMNAPKVLSTRRWFINQIVQGCGNPPLYENIVFGKPFLLYHRAERFSGTSKVDMNAPKILSKKRQGGLSTR